MEAARRSNLRHRYAKRRVRHLPQADQGKLLAEYDDIVPDQNLNSRVVFTAKEDGTYRIVATSFEQQGVGSYTGAELGQPAFLTP